MKVIASEPTVDTRDEIATLIEILHDTESRLELLTAGAVDTVVNRAGRTMLLWRAQERLRRTDAEKQQAIINAVPAHIALLDASGTIVSVNDAWRRYADVNGSPGANYGVGLSYLDSCEGVAGSMSSEAIAVAAGIRAVLQGEISQYTREYACHSLTEQSWFLMLVTPLAGEWPGGAIVMHIDITERTLAAQASRQTAALLQTVVDGLPDPIYLKDLHGRYRLCNRAVADYLGVPRDQLLGRDNSGLIADEDRIAPTDSDRRVIESGRIDTSEYSITVGGQRRTFHTVKAPYYDEERQLVGVLGISRDVTERRRDELARDSERLLLRTLIDALPDVVYTKDLDGRYVICNRATLTQFGLTQEHELAGKTAFDILPAVVAERARADDARVLAGEPVLHRIDHRIDAAGVATWHSIVKVPLRDGAGQITGLVGFNRNVTEYQQARQDLVDRKAMLKMVSRIAKVGGWSLDLRESRLSWSDTLAELHDQAPGYAPSLEENIDSFLPEYRARVRAAIDRCASRGNPYDLEVEKITGRGRRIWVRTMGEAVQNAEGLIVRLQGAVQDVTERKLAEVESRRIAERLSKTLESITDAFLTVDHDWCITYVNGEAERLIHKGRAELIGQVLWEPFAPALGTAFEDGYRRAMAGETEVAFEALYAPWGLWVGVNCYPTEDGLSVYFRDVTAKRASRRRLELLEASVSQLQDQVMIAVAGPPDDPGLKIEFVNEAFVRTTGHSREDVVGKSPHLLYGPLTDRREIERLRLAGERREAVHSELLTYRKSGEPYWSEVDIVPIAVHADEHSHYVAVGRDISERRRDREALRELNTALEARVRTRTAELDLARELAEQANRAKSVFLATISHEIRTPMNGVIGMIDVLEQTSLRTSQLDIVRTARQSAYALMAIVDDVLDFSKIEAGQFQIDNEPMSVAAVVEGVCDALDHLSASKGVALGLFVDPRLPERTMGDAARLRQVLMNLVDNAIKFTSRGAHPGQVKVRAVAARQSTGPALIEISVADNGIGMDNTTLERLFEPFTQADSRTTRRFGGTGLGLAISRRLVELMGGSIRVWSAAGQGSTFTVSLSLSPAPPLSVTDSTDSIDVGGSELKGQRCVVLGAAGGAADDLAIYLQHAGARVERAQELASAVALIKEGPPGSCVVVIAIAGSSLEAPLADCRAAGRERPDVALRFLVIEHGRRRTPRVKAEDLVSLDGESLHRAAFLRGVALASGTIVVNEVQDTPFGIETVPMSLHELDASVPRQTILVAEDNAINQKVLSKQLALLGFDADIAANGREALDCWRAADYALLITDLHMPQMDGYELATAIRAAEAGQRHIPIVAVTANAVKGEARRCHDVGMDAYLTKPVQLSALKALLSRWLTPPVAAPETLETNPPARTLSGREAQAGATPADLSVLAALVGEDVGEMTEVLAMFHTVSEQLRDQIRQGFSSGSLEAVADAAHKLKSNARSIGAFAFGATCADLEEAAEAGNADGLRLRIAPFEAELAALCLYLASTAPADLRSVDGRRR